MTRTFTTGGVAVFMCAIFGTTIDAAEPLQTRDQVLESYARNYEEFDWVDLDPAPELVALGKTLFFDPRLSKTGSQSCASCHNPGLGWGDGLAVGIGHDMKPLARRSPTILNTAFAAALMWDGRAADLEEQALGPIQSSAEMNMDMGILLERLNGIAGYGPLMDAAYGDRTITAERIAHAIAAFETTIISGEAPFDRWQAGDETAVTEQVKQGFDLFNGKGKCAQCHDTWRFTDDSFHDVGIDDEDIGRGRQLPTIPAMQHAFKTPTLRNIDQRAPYMHAGSIATLRDVVVHYNEGGVARPSRSADVGNLGLTEGEIDDIVAFMESLTSVDAEISVPVLPR